MKNIVQPTTPNRFNKDEAIKYIQQIYGEASTEFDDACIGSVTIQYLQGKKPLAFIEYISIKVKAKDGHVAYWPIQGFDEDVDYLVALKTLQRKYPIGSEGLAGCR